MPRVWVPPVSGPSRLGHEAVSLPCSGLLGSIGRVGGSECRVGGFVGLVDFLSSWPNSSRFSARLRPIVALAHAVEHI
eukprot:2656318-Pyramimonas_sp.AAC.1